MYKSFNLPICIFAYLKQRNILHRLQQKSNNLSQFLTWHFVILASTKHYSLYKELLSSYVLSLKGFLNIGTT